MKKYSKLCMTVLSLASLLVGVAIPVCGQRSQVARDLEEQDLGWQEPKIAVAQAGDGTTASSTEGRARGELEVDESVTLSVSRGQRSLRFQLERGGKEIFLSEIDPSRTPWILDRFVLGWMEIHPEAHLSAVFFEFLDNQGGRKFNDTRTWFRVCVLKDFQPASPCQSFEVAATDIAYYFSLEPKRKWVYLAIDKDEPATISDARVLTLDANEDGYRDLILWRKQCRAMTPDEVRHRSEQEEQEDDEQSSELAPECDLHFLLDEETIQVSLFQPATSTFSSPQAAQELSIPDNFEWRLLPSLQWVFIP